MTGRRWRRFVRRQRSPVVARWLRWTQTCRDLEPDLFTPLRGPIIIPDPDGGPGATIDSW